MIDLHSHILPGIDDGARDLGESLSMARALVASGTQVVAATPHVRHDYPTPVETMERLVRELASELAAEAIPLEVVSGAEVALDRVAEISKEDLVRLSIGGHGQYLLIEPPYQGWPLDVGQRLFELRIAGLIAIVAHPERNRAIQADPERLTPLVEAGALVQLTAASLEGALGRASRAAGRRLIDLGLAHLVASDAHAVTGRGLDLRAAAATVGDRALAGWLVSDVPAAILAGDDPPERPRAGRRRRAWWRP